MTITDLKDTVGIEMDERVWEQLLALPYKIEVDGVGHLVMTPLQEPGLSFEELATTHPILPEELSWKVETNHRNQIIMSPPPHGEYGTEILLLLNDLLPAGRVIMGSGVKTSNGTRVPDVLWISSERRRKHHGEASYSQAPEICVEVLSPCNSRREIEEKKRLYLGAGALETWICERDGTVRFFDADGLLSASRVCPDLPARVNILD